MDEFNFVADYKYRSLLLRDFEELKKCLDIKASKSVLILSGSIIETVLLEFFTHNLPGNLTKQQLLRKSLADLINLAESIDLISKQSKELSTVVKNYRNLIHPGREVRTNEQFDFDTATVSFSLVKIILKEVKQKYVQKYGYTSQDIFNKILVDNATYSIYDKLINKLNEHEKEKLIDLLVEYEIDNYKIDKRPIVIRYIAPLKDKIEEEKLLKYCKRLLKEVEKGEKHHIYALFEMFGDNINLLNIDEKDLILAYIYDKVKSVSAWTEDIQKVRIQNLFKHLHIHLYSAEIKQKFFDLLVHLARCHGYTDKEKWHFTSTYKDLTDQLSPDQQEKCEEYVRDNLGQETAEVFFQRVEDDLPF